MFNVSLHSRSAIEAHRTRWRFESAQYLRSSQSLTKLVGAQIRRHKPYTKGIAKVYNLRGTNKVKTVQKNDLTIS